MTRYAAALLVLTTLILTFSRAVASDHENGRYQIVAIPPTQADTASRAMILDTRDGYLWQWWQGNTSGGAPAEGITYLGKITPVISPGETIPITRFARPHR